MIARKTVVSECKNVVEVLEKSGLNFIPEKHGLFADNGVSIPEHIGIIRNDNSHVLGVMGKDYAVIPPHESFAIADILCERFGLKFWNAYGIDGGKKIRITLRGKDFFADKLQKDQIIEEHSITDAYDGSEKFTYGKGLWRVVCGNGMTVKLEGTKTSIRHTKNADERIHEAMRIWADTQNVFGEIQRRIQSLAQKIVDHVMVEKFLDGLIGKTDGKVSTRKKNQREDVLHLFERGRGNVGTTAWDLVNAASEYYDHHVNRENPDAALASQLFGNGADQKERAFSIAETL